MCFFRLLVRYALHYPLAMTVSDVLRSQVSIPEHSVQNFRTEFRKDEIVEVGQRIACSYVHAYTMYIFLRTSLQKKAENTNLDVFRMFRFEVIDSS